MNVYNLSQDIEGRIKNLNWKPSSQWIMPILEAVSNSLHATSHLNNEDKIIKINLIREGDSSLDIATDKQRERPIIGFKVEDNGIGFTDENFEAFKTIDTRHKAVIGGKGIGRLFWLKAFTRVKIRSTYRQGELYCQRSINFDIDGIKSDEPIKIKENNAIKTQIEVADLKQQYKKYFHRLATTVAKEIADEFLPYFVLNGWPGILSVSFTDSGEKAVNVRDYACYDHEFDKFEIKEQKFSIIHVLNYEQDKHKILFCAADRVVSGYKNDTSNIIPKKQLQNKQGAFFWYMGLICSEYLTKNVSTERDDFLIPESNSGIENLGLDKEVALDEIHSKIKEIVSQYLKSSLEMAQRETVKNIANVLNSNPELKVVPFSDTDIGDLLSSNEGEIKKKFRQKLYEHLDNSKEEINALISRIGSEKTIDFESFKSEFYSEVRRYSLLNQSHIVSYILYRKQVLALFEKSINVFSCDQTAKESFIHNLIFPMQQQGEPCDFGTNHNLWMIDDKLSMVDWIASDLPITKHGTIEYSSSKKEPDLVFYNLAYANKSESTSSSGYNEIHIIEFKRPFSLKNNPIEQINNYIYDIKKSKIKAILPDGNIYRQTERKLSVSKNAIFYGYVIFDLKSVENTDVWNRMVHNCKLKPYMNGYMYHDENIVIFVNSFENILEISKKRNLVFFNKIDSAINYIS